MYTNLKLETLICSVSVYIVISQMEDAMVFAWKTLTLKFGGVRYMVIRTNVKPVSHCLTNRGIR